MKTILAILKNVSTYFGHNQNMVMLLRTNQSRRLHETRDIVPCFTEYFNLLKQAESSQGLNPGSLHE